MPFPLAHPAVVLPLRRLRARWFSLPGLVIGSITPDSAYLFRRLRLEEVSHSAWGLLTYCLPAGLLLTLVVSAIRPKLVEMLPARTRFLLTPQHWQGRASLIATVISVLVGAATHLGWDSFTHAGGWAAEQLPALQTTVGSFAGHNVKLCRLLWYASSFAGIAYVYLVYQESLQPRRPRHESAQAAGASNHLKWVEAFGVAALVIPIELVHDLVHGPVGAFLVAALSLALVLGVLWINGRHGQEPPG